MKQLVRRIGLLLVTIIISIPCTIYSYNFDGKVSEERAIQKRKEIYELYNEHKNMINESDDDNNEFGVLGYNGNCETVNLNGKSIPLDEYVAGVVKAEAAPGNIESYKAQAIAARSFVLFKKKDDSTCTISSGQHFQVYTEDNDSNSIYHKAAKETSMMIVERNGEVAETAYQSFPAGRWQKEDSSGWHVTFQRFSDDPSTTWVWNGPPKSKVFSVTSGTEMDYNNEHNWGMSQTISAYLALEENYTYDKLIKLFYDRPIVTLSDGKYDGNMSYGDGYFKNVIYFNQGDYGAYQYHPACGSIQACGCGPTSVAIVASSILKRQISPVETTNKLCAMNGCTAGGSYATSLTQELNSVYHLNARNSNSDQEALNALKTGKALVIVNVGYGFFCSGSGHFMVLAGANKKGEVLVYDPGSREKTGNWYSFNLVMESRKRHEASYIIVTK